MNAHRLAEARSLALHRLIADELERDPERRAAARARVARWRAEGLVHAHYAQEWARLLDGPLAQLLACLRDEGEPSRALRQVTPFAGFIDPRRRWSLWREVRENREGQG